MELKRKVIGSGWVIGSGLSLNETGTRTVVLDSRATESDLVPVMVIGFGSHNYHTHL